MKNKQSGFVTSLVIIICLLIIGGVAYWYTAFNNNTKQVVINNKTEIATTTQEQTSSVPIENKNIQPTDSLKEVGVDINTDKQNKITLKLDSNLEYGKPVEPVSWLVMPYGPGNKKVEEMKEEFNNIKDIEVFNKLYESINKYKTTMSGEFNETLTIQLENDFTGQIVVKVSYESDSGKYVYGEESIAINRPPGKMVGIKLSRTNSELGKGAEVPVSEFEVLGVFDSGDEYPIYVNENNIKYEIENEKVAIITGDRYRTVRFLSPGVTKLKVIYKEKNIENSLTAYSTIVVQNDYIGLISPIEISGKVGYPLEYKIKTTRDGDVSKLEVKEIYGKEGEFNFDEKNWKIYGTPHREGYYGFNILITSKDNLTNRLVLGLTVSKDETNSDVDHLTWSLIQKNVTIEQANVFCSKIKPEGGWRIPTLSELKKAMEDQFLEGDSISGGNFESSNYWTSTKEKHTGWNWAVFHINKIVLFPGFGRNMVLVMTEI